MASSGVHLFAHFTADAAPASGASTLPLEAIAEARTGPKWFQAHPSSGDGVTRDIPLRAKAAGHAAIVPAADALRPGMSDHVIRMGMPFPPDTTFGNNDPGYSGRGGWPARRP